jgi:predicted transcriptional regulator
VVDGGDEVTSRVRSVRLPDSLWEQLQVLASARGVSVSTVILMALSEFEKGEAKWEKR